MEEEVVGARAVEEEVVGARAEAEGMVRLVLWGGGGWLLTTLQNRISTCVQ